MRSLFREFVVAKQRNEDEHDRRMVLAYTIEGLHRQKKLPDIKSLLTKRAPKKQTIQQMSKIVHQISAAYGLTLRKATSPRGASRG